MDKNVVIDSVILYMSNELDDNQLKSLKNCLGKILYKYELNELFNDNEENDNELFVERFR